MGTVLGSVSGYLGGWLDELFMRLVDAALAIPGLLLAIVVVGVFGPSVLNLIVVIGIVFAPRVARLVRALVLDIKSRDFVIAAEVRGESHAYVMFEEILPNALGQIGVEASIRFCYAIFDVASLGFLGLGLQPPSPDWGLQVAEARHYILFAPWTVIFPTLAIGSLIVGLNFFSDGLARMIQGVE